MTRINIDKNNLKVYLPTDKKIKTNIRGFWKGERLYYDYIRQTRIAEGQQRYLIKKNKQEALFYTRQSRAYIWYNKDKVEELRRYRYFAHPRQVKGLKSFLKGLLQTYGGLTIYIKDEQYLAEVWI